LDWSWKDFVLLVFSINKKYPQCRIADKEAIVFVKKMRCGWIFVWICGKYTKGKRNM
jgi:hypothetical protein